MQTKLEILHSVQVRNDDLGHVLRDVKYQLIQLIVQGKIDGVRGQGRRQTSWLKNIRQWTGMTTVHLFRAAVDRIIWSNMIANIHKG